MSNISSTAPISGLEPLKKRRKEARPGEIIQAGLIEFAKNGFAGTKLDDVAKRAGISKGTIYRYFADKEELFLATVQSHVTPTFDGLEIHVDGFEGSARELIKSLFDAVHAMLLKGNLHILLRIIISEGNKFPELPKFYHRAVVSKGQKILSKIVARGVKSGEIREGAAANLPIVIMAPALMAVIWKMTFEQQQSIDMDEFIAAHIDLVLNGFFVSNVENP